MYEVTHKYGNREVNPQSEQDIRNRKAIDHGKPVPLSHPDLVKITRFRLLGWDERSFPYLDLSYCYGEMRDGTPVRVQLDRYQFTKRRWKTEVVEMCKRAGKYGKAMGIFDAFSAG